MGVIRVVLFPVSVREKRDARNATPDSRKDGTAAIISVVAVTLVLVVTADVTYIVASGVGNGVVNGVGIRIGVGNRIGVGIRVSSVYFPLF